MTKDDIIKLAQEAGLFTHKEVQPELEAFANLVAAHEREACAKLCDAINAKHIESYGEYLGNTYAAECADAIRAREGT
jgi:hypothetical protein